MSLIDEIGELQLEGPVACGATLGKSTSACLARQMDWWMPRASLLVWWVLYLHLPMNLVLEMGNDQLCCLADHTLSAVGSGLSCFQCCQPFY